MFELMKNKIEEVVTKKAEVKMLLDENKKITENLENYWNDESTIKTCGMCKKKYSPFANGPEACTFHPGMVRYICCRGCGRDDYYVCCRLCIDCSSGCRTGPHAPLD